MTSPEFDKALLDLRRGLDETLAAQAKERHAINGRLHGVIVELSEQTTQTGRTLTHVGESLESVAVAIGRMEDRLGQIQDRLVGNPELKSTGLVDTVSDLDERVHEVDTRTQAVEGDIVAVRRASAWIKWVLVAIGGVLAWIKTVDLFNWWTDR